METRRSLVHGHIGVSPTFNNCTGSAVEAFFPDNRVACAQTGGRIKPPPYFQTGMFHVNTT